MGSKLFVYGKQEIPLIYKPSLRAKRLSLRISSKKEISLILTVPPRTMASQIDVFLRQCVSWVERQLAKISKEIVIEPGAEVNVNGTVFHCTMDPLRRKPALCKVTKTLRLPPKCLEKDLHEFLKKTAEAVLSPYVLKAAETLGQKVEKITIRDPKSRWGSCSAEKKISLNWRLILAPPEVAQYVCAHEAAHLVHMNHSPAFWKVVESICPSYKSHKKWLKMNGASLMRV